MQQLQTRDYGGSWSSLFASGLEQYAQTDRPKDALSQIAPVYIAATIRAQAGASVPWTIFSGEEDIAEHPFYDLMSMPNDSLAGTQLDELTRAWMLLRGRAFWLLDAEVRGVPTRVRVLEADRVTALKRDGELIGWRYQPCTGAAVNLSTEEVVRFAFADHRDPYGGLSPLEAAQLYASINWRGAKSQDQFYGRGGFPPFYVKFPTEAGNVTQGQQDMMRESFREKYLGMRNRWDPPFMFRGATLESIGINQRDAEWIAEQGLSAKFIFGCYQVPYGYGGFTEDANRSVTVEETRRFWGGTVRQDGQLVTSIINARIFDRFWPGLRMEYDFRSKMAEMMPEEIRASITSMDTLWRMGVPASEAARIVGVTLDAENRPWLDEGFLPFSVVLADQVMAPPEPAVAPVDTGKSARHSRWPKTERLRSALWKTYTARTDKVERRMLSSWRGWLDWLRDYALSNLRSAKATGGAHPAIDSLLVRDEAGKLLPSSAEAGRQAVDRTKADRLAAIKEGYDSVAADLATDDTFDLLDPKVVQALAERTVFIKSSVDGEMDRLRAKVSEGIQSGATIDEIEHDIRAHINQSKLGMARTVARTETMSSFSRARFDAFEQAGIGKEEWLSARDADVRESHQIDGEVAIIGSPFSNGLLYPHDPMGAEDEVINCRCVPLPVVD